ncbi:MAG TPA: hypothetical protein VF306_03855 [Pirellulales bacterium]
MQHDPLQMQFNLALSGARHVEHVVDHAAHELGLPPNHAQCQRHIGRRRRKLLEQLRGVRDHGQRIAQLVGERRNEVILSLLGLLERGDAALHRLQLRFLVGAVPHDLDEADQPALLVVQGCQRAAGPKPAAILAQLPAVVFRLRRSAGCLQFP